MRLDHVVYAAESDGLDATASRLAESLDAEFVDGGVHPGFGTRNTILPVAGGHYVEVGEGRDVGSFVDDKEEGLWEPVGGSVGPVVDSGDGLFDECCEEGPESCVFVEGAADVEGVAAAVEEPVGVDRGLAGGGGEHAGVGEGGEDGLGGGVGAGSGAFFAVDGGGEGLDGVEFLGVLEGAEWFLFVLEVDPAHDVGHGGAALGGGVEEWCEEFLGDGVPEVGVLESSAFACPGGRGEPGGPAEGALPVL